MKQILEELYEGLEDLQNEGIISTAYGSDILSEFYDCLSEYYKEKMPMWAEAYLQIYSWQFQSFHEEVLTYYTNFYGGSDYETIIKTAKYLEGCGYYELAQQYISGAVDCSLYKSLEYPNEKLGTLVKIGDWIEENTETVFQFYVDILMKHKKELI